MVLGAVIGKVTGQSYEEYIRQHILEPLGMDCTDFVYTNHMEPVEAAGSHPLIGFSTLAVPFIKGSVVSDIAGKNLWFRRFYNDQTPPSGLIGPATDAARLAMAYLNRGALNGRRILSEQSVALMTNESHIKKKKNPDSGRAQGIGWQVSNNNGIVLEHTGGGLAFHTMMRLYPGQDFGFVLFTNSTRREARKIIDLAAGIDW